VQIRISARHGTISDETEAKIHAKVEKLDRLFDRLTSIDITVDVEHRESPSVDLRVSAEHKHDFVATVQAGELMAAIDQAMHKVEQQLRKYKERIQSHHRGGVAREAGPPEDLEGEGR
jgi:putative sigma-54 modulation protein